MKLEEKIAGEVVVSENPGLTLRKWRNIFKASQRDLARKMDVNPSMISDYESGRRKSPGAKFIKRFVTALIAIDNERGGRVQKMHTYQISEAIISIGEFAVPVKGTEIMKMINGKNVSGVEITKDVFGYTIIDSLKAIINFNADEYIQIYGWSTERVLIFTGIKYGRSPMIAIRTHLLKPAMVVYHRPQSVDELAIKLAKIEGIPLIVTTMDLASIRERLEKLKIGR